MMVEQWNMVPLHQLPIKIIDGDRSSRYPKRNEFQSVGVPFLNSTNIVENRLSIAGCNLISEEKYESIRKGRVMHGDIIMTTRGSIGKIAIAHRRRIDRAIINAQMLLLRSDEVTVHFQFLFYVMCSDEFQMEMRNFASGSAQPQIPITDLKHVSIPLPPFNTQRKIAAILSAYDDLIENNLRRIKILEEMAQNLYREWFVKFRFPGYEKVKFVDSPLGMIPEGWEVTTLGDYCCLTMGQSPKSEYYNDVGNGLPFHQGVSDFGHWHPSDRLYCSVDNRIAEANDILFSVRAPVGRMNFANKKIIIGRGLSAIRAKNNAQSFLWEQLRHQFTKVDMIGNGAIFASVTKNDMQRISILSPPDSVVEIVNQYLAPLHNQISCLVRRNDSIRTQRDHLLPKLVSGEVDVSDLNIKVSEEVFE